MLSIGDTVLLETIASDDDDKIVFRSKVLDIKDGTFSIGPPIKEETNRTEPIILENTAFEVQFVAKNQKVYKFQTKVIEKKRNGITMFELELPDEKEFINIQRRSFIRVEAQLKVKVISPSNEFSAFDTYSVDISAGGLKAILPKNITLEEEQAAICSFILPLSENDVFMQLKSKVVRITDKISKRYVSFQFEGITEHERQSIVKYCFERQLALRRKGF